MCPSVTELERLLNEELGDAEVSRLEAHLENCPACQQTLERLSGSLDEMCPAARSVADLENGADTEWLIQRLKVAPPQTEDYDTRSFHTPRSPFCAPAELPGYEILGELGRGGMGVVYKARQLSLNRLVAVKVILHGAHAGSQEQVRFRTEAETVARFRHPNIIQIHEIGDADGRCFFALEYAAGGNLEQKLDGKPQSPRLAAELVETLARAIHYAHQQGVVHRDLKPANVLLAGSTEGMAAEPQGHGDTTSGPLAFTRWPKVVKITDFGLAKQLDSGLRLTASGVLAGTPSYMAPEQASGKAAEAGPAADIWALGATLYEVLTGRPPFLAANEVDTLLQVRTQDPVPPRRLQPQTPRDLETICLSCLQKEPARRYASADALADDLRRFLHHEPIKARPVGALEKAWKWGQRRPTIVALMGAVVGVALLGLGLVLWQWQRAEREADARGQALAVADQARREAEAAQAQLALDQGLTLCEQGEIGRGLMLLTQSLELADRAGATHLDRAIRINLADWAAELSRPGHRLQHPILVHALAFRPDGHMLTSVGWDARCRFWDVATGKETGPVLWHPTWTLQMVRRVWDVAFSPDGKTVVTGTTDKTARLWDVATGRQIGPSLVHPAGDVWAVAFGPDGKWVLTACSNGSLQRWDVATGKPLGAPLHHPKQPHAFQAMALSPDGKTVAHGGGDGLVRLWDLTTGQTIDPPLNCGSLVRVIRFSPSGQQIMTGTEGGALRLWDRATGQALELPNQGAPVRAAAFSPNGAALATGSAGGIVRLWDLGTLRQVGPTYRNNEAVTAVAFPPDGTSLAIGTSDGAIRFWSVPGSRAVGTPLVHTGPVHTVVFDRAGRTLLTACPKGARLWDAISGEPQGPWLVCNKASILSAAGNPELRRVALGQDYGFVEFFDPVQGTQLRKESQSTEGVQIAVLAPDENKVLAYSPRKQEYTSDPGSCRVWDLCTGEPQRTLLGDLHVPVNRIAYHPDGRTLLLACRDQTARFWDVAADGPLGPPLPHAATVTSVAFSPDGSRAVTGCRDGTAWMWDVASRAPVLGPLRHEDEVTAVAFSPDGSTLVTASLDRTARFWDAASGKPLGPARRHGEGILTVAWCSAGHLIVTGGRDKVALRWQGPASAVEGDVQEIRQWVGRLNDMGQ